jgi:hypothetical protein
MGRNSGTSKSRREQRKCLYHGQELRNLQILKRAEEVFVSWAGTQEPPNLEESRGSALYHGQELRNVKI